MTVRELRQLLFKIDEQDAEIADFKFSESSPELIITVEDKGKAHEYRFPINP